MRKLNNPRRCSARAKAAEGSLQVAVPPPQGRLKVGGSVLHWLRRARALAGIVAALCLPAATASADTSDPVELTGATAAAAPSKPAVVYLAEQDGRLQFWWQGQPNLTEIHLNYGPNLEHNLKQASVPGNTSSYQEDNGTEAQFRLRFKNASGYGPWSDVLKGTPGPETLAADAITHNSATLTLSKYEGWGHPDNASREARGDWSYKYTSPAGGQCTNVAKTSGTGADVTGLVANTSYTFAAYSGSGCSTTALATADAFPTLPPKPAKPTVAVNNGEFTLSSSVTGGDAAILKWQYVEKAGNGTFETVWKDISNTSKDLNHAVSGLEAGSYQFKVRAVNASGNGPESDASDATGPRVTSPPPGGGPAAGPGTALDRARDAVRRVLNRTLAAVGTRTLTSALGNIGARLADGAPGAGLTLAGEAVPVGAGVAPAGGADGSCAAGGPGCGAADGRAVGWGELFRTSAFSMPLGAAPGAAGAASAGPLWSLWGRGDFGSFEGRPEPGGRYSGDLRTGWLGFDGRAGPWVAGIAVSRGESETDYGVGGGIDGLGRLETELTAVYPYGRWTLADGLELRGVVGGGTGEARHHPEGGAAETSDLSMRMASAGVRRALPAPGGLDLAARADMSVVRLEIGDGPAFISGVSADSWRLRAGLEASRRFALEGGAALAPFAEAAGRRDGGDGLTGMGLEVAGGVRYTAPRLQVEARGRWLAAHSEEGARERGVSVTARVGPGAQGRGLSLSLSPRWGADTGAAALWRDGMPGRPGDAAESGALDARVGYGFAPAPAGLLTPFAEMGLSGGEDRRLGIGTRFEARPAGLSLELSGERRESGGAAPDHGVLLDVRLRF